MKTSMGSLYGESRCLQNDGLSTETGHFFQSVLTTTHERKPTFPQSLPPYQILVMIAK